jgi:hypothetical protein
MKEIIETELRADLARVSVLVDQLTIARLQRLADRRWSQLSRGRFSTLVREILQLAAQAEPGQSALVLLPRDSKPTDAPSVDL